MNESLVVVLVNYPFKYKQGRKLFIVWSADMV